MYLFEMKNLPTKAGKAEIEWTSGLTTPSRNGKNIGLPNDKQGMYYPLANKGQFIFRSIYSNNVWFGGTDEEPFLVEMEKEAGHSFIKSEGSERAFYGDLVPKKVFAMCVENNDSYKRQGDIFGVRFCGERYFDMKLAQLIDCKPQQGEMRILQTRHQGIGKKIMIGNETLFKGIIQAPDHAPLSLEDGFYLLGQTRYIVEPTKAD